MDPRTLWRDPGHLIAFGFGSGLVRVAPGTFGTLVAVPMFYLLAGLALPLYLLILAVFFVLGVVLCERTTRAMNVHDHPAIVWDEVVGYLLVMAAAPAFWWAPLLGFVLFRIFDIAKPWPIGWVDRRVSGGVGIMLDDVLAAVPAWLLLQGAAALAS